MKKRFIAGAVCPSCALMDKLFTYQREGKEFRECVSCGFSDEMKFKPQVRELETRVNTPEDIKQEETQVLILDPGSKKDRKP